MNHPWVVAFVQEQDYIIDTITNEFLAQDPGWKDDKKAQRNGRYSSKVFISHLYQATEARVMKAIMNHFADCQVLLWVHDGFCTRHRVSVGDAHTIMRLDYHMPDWELEETPHKGWADPALPKFTAEQQRIINEQQEREERAQRHSAELDMWAARGHDVTGLRNQPRPEFQFKRNTEGHYADGVSDYDAGRDPYATSSRGLLNEQQFIARIYGNK
jgi:hypothetical protein